MEIECRGKHMTRLEIVYMTVTIVIRYLLRKDFADVIPEDLGHYLDEGDHNRACTTAWMRPAKPGPRKAAYPKPSMRCWPSMDP